MANRNKDFLKEHKQALAVKENMHLIFQSSTKALVTIFIFASHIQLQQATCKM